MKLSLNIGSREFSIGAVKSGSLVDWAKGGGGEMSGAKLTSPYQQSTWVYACVAACAQQVAQIPFRFSRTTRAPMKARHGRWRTKAVGEQIVESGPVVELFNRPHPHLNRFQFWELMVSWLQLRGEFFAVPLDGNLRVADANPFMLAVLSPDNFREDVRANMLAGWRYQGTTTSPSPSLDLLPGDVIMDRLSNPFDFWRGLSPISVARLAADSDYASAQFEKGLMLNNADTGVIVTTEQQATPEQQQQILTALRARKRKAGTADLPLFLFGGATVNKPTITSADMQFLEGRKFKRQEICAILRTPQEIIGFTEDANRSVSDSARLNWIENMIAPMCERIEAAFEPFIKSLDAGLTGWFDLECLPIMQAARRARYAGAVQAFGIGVPIDDCSAIFDLGLPDDLPHAGRSYLPFGLQEVGQEQGLPAEDVPPAESTNTFERALKLLGNIQHPTSNTEHSTKGTDVAALWRKHVAERRASVKLFQGKTVKVLLKYRTKTLAKLQEELGKSKSLIDLIFDAAGFGEALADELESPLRLTLQSAAEDLMAEVGYSDPWKYPPKAVLEFLTSRRVKIQDCGTTIRNQINTTLSEGVTAGETQAQLAARVKAAFDDITTGQAQTIARTEVNVAYNTARQEAIAGAGIEYKAWLSSHGPHVRAGHAQAERDYIDAPIPVDDPFIVDGEQLMFPGDDSMGASLGNIINCQCIQLAARKVSENATSLTFKVFGAGDMTFTRGGAR